MSYPLWQFEVVCNNGEVITFWGLELSAEDALLAVLKNFELADILIKNQGFKTITCIGSPDAQ